MPLLPGHLRLVESTSHAAPELAASAAPDDEREPIGYAELFERFSGHVARIGLRLLGRDAEVDDLVQEVFFAAFAQNEKLRDPQAAKGWLSVVAVRVARRKLRRRRLRQFVGLDAGSPALELQDRSLSGDAHVLMSRVYRALDRIDVESRLAWTLRYVEGEKLEEVAERCGCSLATAKRRIAAAHSRLQIELGGLDHG